MSAEMHFYEPAQGHQLGHDPFNAIIAPRPIGWISSQNPAGQLNLAPYSFFNAFNYTPPIIGFASIRRKDSLRNVEATGEFVWNLVTRELAESMNKTSASVAPEVDEFVISGLTPEPSRLVKPPRVKECPVSMECRVTQILQLKTAAGHEVDSWLVLGEVVGIHISKTLLTNGVYSTAAAEPVQRGGGAADYFQITADALFRMTRPP